MRFKRLGMTACLATVAAASVQAQAQGVGGPSAYGGFGGGYVQAPSLYYPYPGVIESRYGTFFTVPVIPGVPESPIEAATVEATNAAHARNRAEAIDPVAANAPEAKDAAAGVGANRKPTRTYARGYSRPPAPFRRALPRGNLADLNLAPGGGIPAYTPESRYQTYGQAYGMGPYGTNYYSGYWHGYAPMNYYPAPVVPGP